MQEEMIKINEIFFRRHREILGDHFEEFLRFLERIPNDTIRVNTLKIGREELRERLEEKGWKLKDIPFYRDAFEVIERDRPIGATLEYSLGYYYPQEKASLIPPIILDPRQGEIVLDLCAAPGSKTTQISMMMENKGLIIANDVEYSRIKILISNIQRMGCLNVVVTRMDGRKFGRFEERFDRVLVDVPCTGTGTIVWEYDPIKRWSPKLSRNFSKLQLRLLEAGFKAVKDNGIVVYSTCSLEPEEDELVINKFLERNENAKVERVKVERLNSMDGITEWEGEKLYEDVKNCLRIYPHLNESEGFFVARIRKVS